MNHFIGFLTIIFPAFVVSRWMSSKNRTINFLLLTFFLPSSILFLMHQSGLGLSQRNMSWVLYILNSIFIYLLLSKKRQKNIYYKKNLKKFIKNILAQIKNNHASIIIVVVVIAYLVWLLFFKHPINLSGDVAHFIKNSGLLAQSGRLKIVFDRNFIYIFPAMIYQILGTSIHNGVKILSALFFIITILTTYSISKKLSNSTLMSVISSLLIAFTPTQIKSSLYTIPFSIGITILYVIVDLFWEKEVSRKSLLWIYILWAFLFNIHGAIAFASLVIVPLLLILNTRGNKKTLHLFGLIMFFIIAQPLLFKHSVKILPGVVQPIVGKFQSIMPNKKLLSSEKTTEVIKPDTSQASDKKTTSDQRWVQSWVNTPKLSLKDFPLKKDIFMKKYTFIMVFFALFGLWRDWHKRKSVNQFFILTVLFILLTQQSFLGIDWFSGRFVSALAMPVYTYAVYGIFQFFTNLKRMFSMVPITFSVILLIGVVNYPIIADTFEWISKTAPSISEKEFNMYKNINNYTTSKEIVYASSSYNQWAIGLDPRVNFFTTHYKTMCYADIGRPKNNPEIWDINRAFSDEYPIDQSIKILSDYTNNQNYLVYINTNSPNCINPNNFPSSEYERLIDDNDGHYLLRKK